MPTDIAVTQAQIAQCTVGGQDVSGQDVVERCLLDVLDRQS